MDVEPSVIRRNIIIALLLIMGMLAGALTWFVPEALRVKRERDRRVAEAAAGSDMVRIAGGSFTMGANDGAPDERPLHDVRVNDFWIDRHEVTNAEFERFVRSTHYITTAEKPPATWAKDAPPAQHRPGSWCVRPKENAVYADRRTWAEWVPGADWRHPEGPGSSVDGKGTHPVVHVSYDDALAYCKWSGKRLPTEAEWEYAARGGIVHNSYPWGQEPLLNGAYMANAWQGPFPKNELKDQFDYTAPVASFPPNNYTVYDMAGNVAEWCSDWYSNAYYAEIQPNPDRTAHRNPKGPETSNDPTEPGVWKHVVRGGSFLTTDADLRVAARGREEPQFTAQWLGFRCVKENQ